MPGSSLSIAGPNFVLNTAVAEVLKQFADELEGVKDFTASLNNLIKRTIREHKRIIFNGNGYDDAWIMEALKRGLPNLKTTPDCLPSFVSDKSIKLFTAHNVLTETEIKSRYEIVMENYTKVINIEALTMLDMAKKDIMPAVSAYSKAISDTANSKIAFVSNVDCTYEAETLKNLARGAANLYNKTTDLEKALLNAKEHSDATELANYYKDNVIPAMSELRISADELETITAKSYWPYPSYGDLLFSVK